MSSRRVSYVNGHGDLLTRHGNVDTKTIHVSPTDSHKSPYLTRVEYNAFKSRDNYIYNCIEYLIIVLVENKTNI